MERESLNEELEELKRQRIGINAKIELLERILAKPASAVAPPAPSPPVSSAGSEDFSLSAVTDLLNSGPPMRSAVYSVLKLKSDPFTKPLLDRWVREQYPILKFSTKSMDRPIADALDAKSLEVLKKSVGHSNAVYRVVLGHQFWNREH